MAGFDCQFVEKPADYLQTHCPVCLLVLREPHQAECCGKSFCKDCVRQIHLRARNRQCPTCNQGRFECFPNKSLQQPLYGFRVFCSNKESGCVWEGELGQLDKHINSNPDKEKQLVGCGYTNVSCVYCEGQHQRQKMEEHQASQCLKRPFTCLMCKEYTSTFSDVVYYHTAECKGRHVVCPNLCGADNLQHQHLEEHVSSQCPLTLVECEFSEAGCSAKLYRKDLPSHLTDNVVTHMSLLAKENRKLRLKVKEQSKEIVALKLKLDKQVQEAQLEFRKLTVSFLSCVPPIELLCPVGVSEIKEPWRSEPFYSHIGGYQLRLLVNFEMSSGVKFIKSCNVTAVVRETEFSVQPRLNLDISVVLVNNRVASYNHCFTITASTSSTTTKSLELNITRQFFLVSFAKDYHILFRVTNVTKALSSNTRQV